MDYGASRGVFLPGDRVPWRVQSHCMHVALLIRYVAEVGACCLSPRTRDNLVTRDIYVVR